MTKPDPRLNAYRHDLADRRLRHDVAADRYVEPFEGRIGVPRAPMLQKPENRAMAVSEALFGDAVAVFEATDNWVWLQSQKDGYVGYVERGHVVLNQSFEPTHQISAAATLLFSAPDLKSKPLCRLFLNTKVAISGPLENQNWVEVSLPGENSPVMGYVYHKHLGAMDRPLADPVALSKQFVGVPYLWGGSTADGLDCSGLIQQTLRACGYDCPRDSDMIENWIGGPQKATPDTGDLVFWNGHVGMMISQDMIVHANAFHLSVKVEQFSEVAERITKEYSSNPRILALN